MEPQRIRQFLVTYNTKSEKEEAKLNKRCSADELRPVKLNATDGDLSCSDDSEDPGNQRFTPVNNLDPIKYAGERPSYEPITFKRPTTTVSSSAPKAVTPQ